MLSVAGWAGEQRIALSLAPTAGRIRASLSLQWRFRFCEHWASRFLQRGGVLLSVAARPASGVSLSRSDFASSRLLGFSLVAACCFRWPGEFWIFAIDMLLSLLAAKI